MRAISAWLLAFACQGALALVAPAAALAEGASETLQARGPGPGELAAWAEQLGLEDAAAREQAIAALGGLPPGSVPGIAARVKQIAAKRPDAERALSALHRFRKALGPAPELQPGETDERDLALGIAPVLAEERGPDVLAMAEPLLLLRSLETLGGVAAGHAMADLLFMDGQAWHQERDRVVGRIGVAMLPALIELRSDARPPVRRWAQQAARKLGMEAPADALALEDPALLAGVVRAYGNPMEFAAMPLIARMLGHEHREVRAAARATIARFGKNAIWQLRELHREIVGEDASKAWDAERTAASLYAVIDAERNRRSDRLLQQGVAKLAERDLAGMAAAFDELLSRDPDFARRAELSPGYAALGDSHLAADRLDAARDAYQRAIRLAPDSEQAPQLRARLAFVDAERALTRGVADLPGYGAALAHDDELSMAREARDRLSGEQQSRKRRNRRLAAVAAILLLLGLMAMMWRRPVDAPRPG